MRSGTWTPAPRTKVGSVTAITECAASAELAREPSGSHLWWTVTEQLDDVAEVLEPFGGRSRGCRKFWPSPERDEHGSIRVQGVIDELLVGASAEACAVRRRWLGVEQCFEVVVLVQEREAESAGHLATERRLAASRQSGNDHATHAHATESYEVAAGTIGCAAWADAARSSADGRRRASGQQRSSGRRPACRVVRVQTVAGRWNGRSVRAGGRQPVRRKVGKTAMLGRCTAKLPDATTSSMTLGGVTLSVK